MTRLDAVLAHALDRLGPLRRALESPWFQERARWVLVGGAIVGVGVGVWGTWVHLTTDPFADVHAYYEAGARLNAGRPLYEQDVSSDGSHFYWYPPLLAIVFRPLALLPFEIAAALWGTAMLAAFGLLLWRIGIGPRALLALCYLALPVGWSLAIGQAHILTTLLTALGTPFTIALAANIKVFPGLVGLYWLGRRDWPALARLVAWGLGLVGIQFALEPNATVAYLTFLSVDQVGEVRNLSPFAVSPLIWVALTIAAVALALRLAPTRWGWAAAVVVATVVNPRLLVYQFSALLAGLRAPDQPREPSVARWWAERRASIQ